MSAGEKCFASDPGVTRTTDRDRIPVTKCVWLLKQSSGKVAEVLLPAIPVDGSATQSFGVTPSFPRRSGNGLARRVGDFYATYPWQRYEWEVSKPD